ncbi:MAG: hypothetical protein CMB32_01575 [Euryarchaeota archaeon]|nr:hypothetical protein [Euryarchaeota archaeon]|tara:strand:- start:1305 stop:3989 length:2685 start_codon:yes stop_codon:yes gene_type:complete
MKQFSLSLLSFLFVLGVSAQCDESTIIVNILTDNYPGETTWVLMEGDQEIANGNGYSANGTLYSDTICVLSQPDTCVTFTLYDSYGDGLCCGYGLGGFSVVLNGDTVIQGGEFGGEISGSFLCPESEEEEEEEEEEEGGNEFCDDGATQVVVSILTDNYPGETTWTLYDSDGILLSGGPYQENGTLYNDTICVPDDGDPHCFQFYLNDSYGDGICCAYGQGSYALYVDSVEIASGGQFDYEEYIQFDCEPGMTCADAVNLTTEDYGTIVQELGNFWYTFTPEETGVYELNSCGSGCNSTLYIYDYCNMANFDNSNEGTIYFDDYEAGCGYEAGLTVLLEGGVTYWVRWGSSTGECGGYSWNFDFIGPPSGCTDEEACNYNPLAEVDNGTCIYEGDPNCSGPDLLIVTEAITNSLYATTMEVGETDCYIEEGCLNGFGTRELIRFTTHIKNVGELDYYIGTPSNNDETQQFEWGDCHNHWHYEGYAKYDLFDMDGGFIPVGFKNGFCVMDLECSGGGSYQYGCSNMGITAGCGDIYGSGLSCQWIDVTDVEDGEYRLVVRVNWDYDPDALGRYETNTENNWGVVCIDIDRTDGFVVTIIDDCPVFTDCTGEPYGTAIFDCTGECGGAVLMGDVDNDFDQDLVDAQTYVEGVLGNDIPSTDCYDLNSDGDINVTDATIIADCQFWNVAHEHPDSSGVHSHCDFPLPDITNPYDSVSFSIGDVNWDEKYFDVLMLNPDNRVHAYQLEFDGLQIAYTESLLDTEVYTGEGEHTPGGNDVITLSYDGTTIPKHFEYTPIMRVHWFGSANGMVCITEVIDVVNDALQNTVTDLWNECHEQSLSACPGDTDGDLLVTVSDILNVLGDFGCLEDCSFDVSGDGVVNVGDILLVLSAFGDNCQ